MFSICRPVLTWVWIWIVVAATCALVVVVGQQTWDDDFTQDGTSTNNPQQSTNTLAPSTTSNRRLLFRPESLTAFPTDGPDSDWNINYPFPAHSRTNVNPFPLHIALDALSSPQRYTFQVIPSMRVGATLVGFDWKRNRTIGTMVHSSSGSSSSEFVWSDGLPNWLSYVAPSSSADRSFSLVVTVPQSGNHSVLYLSPQPVQITFHAVLQYQMPQPVMDEETEDDNETTGNDDSQSHATRPLSPSSSSPNLSAQPPLILIEELQTVTLLVSLSITPPLSERVLGIPSYSLSQAPNLLDSHVRIKNRRGSPQTTAGLPPFRMDWRDEIVYACQDAIGAECDICTDASIGWINMTSPYCAFPSGSFFNVESGQLRVRRPIHISGQLQINHGAIFEINHGSDSVESSILNGVSIIDCRDEFGQPKPIINQGTIRVQKGSEEDK